jgi:hypothetical protein
VVLCSPVGVHQCFGRTYYHHFQGRRVNQATNMKHQNSSCLAYPSALKMNAVWSSKTTWCHIHEDRTLHNQCRQTVESGVTIIPSWCCTAMSWCGLLC